MSDETRKLLGGYATGTLTPDEKHRLFAAALQDQQLFEALHDEEALRQVLDNSAARAQVLEATQTPEFTIAGGFREWWERPRGKVLATMLGLAVVMMSVRTWQDRTVRPDREQAAKSDAAKTSEAFVRAPVAPPSRTENLRSAPPEDRSVRQSAPQRDAAARPGAKGMIAARPGMVEFAPAPPAPAVAATSAPASVGVRWILERRTADGRFEDATPDTNFEIGDQVRVRVQSPSEGTLAITRGPDQPVFTARVAAGQVVSLPEAITFTDAVEQRLMAVVLPMIPSGQAEFTQFRSAESAAVARRESPKPEFRSEIILRRKK